MNNLKTLVKNYIQHNDEKTRYDILLHFLEIGYSKEQLQIANIMLKDGYIFEAISLEEEEDEDDIE